MNNNINILWVGPIIDPKDLSGLKAISPAANKWQTSLITALNKLGVNTINISYLPEPLFPKGKLVPLYSKDNKFVKSEFTNYLNLPKLREITLSRGLIEKIKKYNNSQFIVTYNNSKTHINVGLFAQRKLKKKWINIVADGKYVEGPDLTIFLSYSYYKSANITNKIHIDGGIDIQILGQNIQNKSLPKVLLFSGALNKWTGIEKFANDFIDLNISDTELHIYGKGNSIVLNNLAESNSKIKLMGFVDENTLQAAMMSCYAFVNPRPIDIVESEYNFPSKLLLYFGFVKPIISTKTSSIAPYYDDVLIYYDPNNIKSMMSAINKVTFMAANDYIKFQSTLRVFVKNHSWSNAGIRLINSLIDL